MVKKRGDPAVIVILIVVVLVAAGIVAYRVTRPHTTINFDSSTITTNFWGAPPDEVLTGGIYLNNDHTFGWYWDRPDPKPRPGNPLVQPLFPNVRIGSDLGQDSNSPLFPVKAGDISRLNFDVDYRYLTLPTGAYNLAYQMYFSDTDRLRKDAIPKIEVMIWIHQTFGQPPTTYIGDYSDGTNTYQLYTYVRTDGRLYSSFIMKGQPVFEAQHTVDAKRLLDNLSLDPNSYLLGVHLGSEIVNGSGKIEIRKFLVNLNGNHN